MAEQLGGGWRRKWEAVLRYIARPKAGVKLLLLLLPCHVLLGSRAATPGPVDTGWRGLVGEPCVAGGQAAVRPPSIERGLPTGGAWLIHRSGVIAAHPSPAPLYQPPAFAFPAGAFSRRLASASR